jgi:hypothetical protein
MTLKLVMHEAFPEVDIAAAKRIAREFDEAAEVSATYSKRPSTQYLPS